MDLAQIIGFEKDFQFFERNVGVDGHGQFAGKRWRRVSRRRAVDGRKGGPDLAPCGGIAAGASAEDTSIKVMGASRAAFLPCPAWLQSGAPGLAVAFACGRRGSIPAGRHSADLF
jgi:hypothetical protein